MKDFIIGDKKRSAVIILSLLGACLAFYIVSTIIRFTLSSYSPRVFVYRLGFIILLAGVCFLAWYSFRKDRKLLLTLSFLTLFTFIPISRGIEGGGTLASVFNFSYLQDYPLDWMIALFITLGGFVFIAILACFVLSYFFNKEIPGMAFLILTVVGVALYLAVFACNIYHAATNDGNGFIISSIYNLYSLFTCLTLGVIGYYLAFTPKDIK